MGSRDIALLFLCTRRKMMVGGYHHAPAALPQGKRHSTHCIKGWVVPEPVWTVRNISSPPGFDHQIAQPVSSRYTD
jgi:hypothetical protein